MLTLVLTAALMGPPAPPRAPEPVKVRKVERAPSLLTCGALTLGSAALDLIATERDLARGSRELNPLAQSPGARMALKAGGSTAVCAIERALAKKGHSKLGRGLVWSWVVANVTAAVLNAK